MEVKDFEKSDITVYVKGDKLEKDSESNLNKLQQKCNSSIIEEENRVIVEWRNCEEIDEKQIEWILNQLEESKSQSIELKFTNNTILTAQSITHLQSLISFNQYFTSFSLSFDYSHSFNDQILQSIASSFYCNHTLQYLYLSFRYSQNITNQGIFYLSQAINNKINSLKSIRLNLEYCFNLNDESIVYLGDSIMNSTILQQIELNLNSCSVTDISLSTIAQAVLSCKQLTSLQLNFEICSQISDVGLSAFSECLNNQTTLISDFSLFLNSNTEISNKGIKKLLSKFYSLNQSFKRVYLSLENMSNVTETILKYINQISSENEENKIQLFTVKVKSCSSFTDLAFLWLNQIFQSKQISIEEFILDFSQQNFFKNIIQSSENYKNMLNGELNCKFKVNLFLENERYFNDEDNEHIKNVIKQQGTTLANQIKINYSPNDKQLANKISNINQFQQKNFPIISNKENSFYILQFIEDIEKKEIGFYEINSSNLNPELQDFQSGNLKINLKLQKCSHLNFLKDIEYCLKQQQNQKISKLEINIIKSNLNEDIQNKQTEISQININNDDIENNEQELDSINLINFIWLMSRQQRILGLSMNIEFGLITDKIFGNMSEVIKQNDNLTELNLKFSQTQTLSDEAFIQFIQIIQSHSSPIISLKLHLLNCLLISDLSIQSFISFLIQNTSLKHIELYLQSSNLITDKSLQELLQAVENDKQNNRSFNIRFILCPQLTLKHMVKLDKAIKLNNSQTQ